MKRAENADQRALRLWITSGHAIPEVVDLHGDAAYLLGNMIAKYTLAADEYAISEGALRRLAADRVDLKVRYARRRFYGKASPYLYEHAVPASIVREALLATDGAAATVMDVLGRGGGVAVLLRDEDAMLREAGLGRKMPAGWVFGDDPLARYHQVGIKLSTSMLRVEGKIMR